MNQNGGMKIAGFLQKQGVSHLFTLVGGHISPILVGAKSLGIRVIDSRGEVNAVFAADAMARLTGKPGIAVVTAGPGVTNTITAVKNASMAQSPLLLFGGAAATVIKGRGSLQDIDQLSLLKPLVKFAVTIKRNCDIIPVLEKAWHAALSGVPGPVFIECPIDLLYEEDLVREWYGRAVSSAKKPDLKSRILSWYLNRHVDNMYACDFDTMEPLTIREQSWKLPGRVITKAVRLLDKAERPVIIVGSQAALHPNEIHRLRESLQRLGFPLYLTGMARGLMGRSSTLQMHHKRREALKEADLVILAGMPFDFRLEYGRAIGKNTPVISVNRSRKDLNLNRRPDLGIHGDPFLFLLKLGEVYTPDRSRFTGWFETLNQREETRNREIHQQGKEKTSQINPVTLLQHIEDFLNDDSLIIADGGDFVATASYILNPRSPLSWLDPGVFGTLGVGGGFALGAAMACPEKEIWIIYGDGASGYSLQEFDSFVRHGVPVIAVVGNDGAWAQIIRDQVEYLHDDVATRLNQSDYHMVAEGFGAQGLLLKEARDIPEVLKKARETARQGKPVLINAHISITDFRKGSISM